MDAICIDQHNDQEKKVQIALMTRIYQQAQTMFADIGKALVDGDAVVGLLKSINEAGHKCDAIVKARDACNPDTPADGTMVGQVMTRFLDDYANRLNEGKRVEEDYACQRLDTPRLEHHNIPSKNDPIWVLFGQFIASPYFRRLWILQEFVLATNICALYGRSQFNLDELMQSQYYLWSYGTGTTDSYFDHSALTAELRQLAGDGQKAFFEMAVEKLYSQKISSAGNPQTCLIHKLKLSKHHAVSDPHDRIYALMGLASDANLYISHIDYTKPYELMYRSFAESFIRNGHGIELLYQACVLNDWDRFPIWIPNWHNTDQRLGRIVQLGDLSDFAASPVSAATILINGAAGSITVHGTIIDSIATRSQSLDRNIGRAFDRPEDADASLYRLEIIHIILFFFEGMRLAKNIARYPTDEDNMDVFFRTLLRGPPSDITERQLQNICHGVSAIYSALQARNHVKNQKLATEIGDDEVFAMGQKFLQNITERVKEGTRHAVRRCFCITARGYFGLVPDKVQVGDNVAIFDGGPVPFPLREAEGRSPENQAYRLVGDGYFHGLMHGEASALDGYLERDIVFIQANEMTTPSQ